MAKLNRYLGVGLGVDKIDDPIPRSFMLAAIKPGAARRDAAFRRHASHLGKDQPCPTFGTLGVMHEMPVGRQAVSRAVLSHRRHYDAVLQYYTAHSEGHEARCPHRLGLAAGRLALEPALRISEPNFVALTQVLMADTLRACEQRIVELNGVELEVTLDVLKPLRRIARRALQPQNLKPPLAFIAKKGTLHRRLTVQIFRQGDGAFEREFRA